mmetsp:Transcript_17930/g.39466  ORF Transcript_17930/g.39466 Transcript_17930/m.39466 type:complete len:209 (+) Transcript_17930:330-956(+)
MRTTRSPIRSTRGPRRRRRWHCRRRSSGTACRQAGSALAASSLSWRTSGGRTPRGAPANTMWVASPLVSAPSQIIPSMRSIGVSSRTMVPPARPSWHMRACPCPRTPSSRSPPWTLGRLPRWRWAAVFGLAEPRRFVAAGLAIAVRPRKAHYLVAAARPRGSTSRRTHRNMCLPSRPLQWPRQRRSPRQPPRCGLRRPERKCGEARCR